MNAFGFLFGTALLATGTAGWVVTTRVNGNPLTDLRERFGSGTDDLDETAEWAGRPESADGNEDEADAEAEEFAFAGKVDYTPGAKRRLIAVGLLIVTVAVVGALVAGLIGVLVWAINAGITGYMNSG